MLGVSDSGIHFHLVDLAEEHDDLIFLDKSVNPFFSFQSYKADWDKLATTPRTVPSEVLS
jgi:hypothetical protein